MLVTRSPEAEGNLSGAVQGPPRVALGSKSGTPFASAARLSSEGWEDALTQLAALRTSCPGGPVQRSELLQAVPFAHPETWGNQ